MGDPIDLKLIETKDLIGELFSRCDHGVISLLREGTPKSMTIHRHMTGNGLLCIGLVWDSIEYIKVHLLKTQIKINPEMEIK